CAREPMLFTDLFSGSRSRLELIVTLMAVLELLKHGQARVEQEASFGPIWIYRGANFGREMGQGDWEGETGVPAEMSAPFVDQNQDGDLSMRAPEDVALHDSTNAAESGLDEHGESEPR